MTVYLAASLQEARRLRDADPRRRGPDVLLTPARLQRRAHIVSPYGIASRPQYRLVTSQRWYATPEDQPDYSMPDILHVLWQGMDTRASWMDFYTVVLKRSRWEYGWPGRLTSAVPQVTFIEAWTARTNDALHASGQLPPGTMLDYAFTDALRTQDLYQHLAPVQSLKYLAPGVL